MKSITGLIRWFFDPEYRKAQRQTELKFVQNQIKVLNGELAGRKEFIFSIHDNAVDKNSNFERERHQARLTEMQRNYQLLEFFLERENFLKKKLKITQLAK